MTSQSPDATRSLISCSFDPNRNWNSFESAEERSGKSAQSTEYSPILVMQGNFLNPQTAPREKRKINVLLLYRLIHRQNSVVCQSDSASATRLQLLPSLAQASPTAFGLVKMGGSALSDAADKERLSSERKKQQKYLSGNDLVVT
jgi:hypothetical protein